MREALSVTIITLNAARQLEACLESVAFADDIVVVDAGSSDDTVAVAQRHGARVLHQHWLGYGKQKQFAVTQARHRWVLCVDADERVSEALRAAIQAELAAPRRHAYRMARRNHFMGRWLRHGEGYPDWSLRLFDRDHANWSDDIIHENVQTLSVPATLAGDLLHESETGIAEYMDKQNRYTTLQAQALYARRRRPSTTKLLFGPVLRFIKFYVLRLGFLDGVPGLMHILIGCHNSFLKQAKLFELHYRRGRE